MATVDSFRPRRDSHNHQPRVKPTSFRVSLKNKNFDSSHSKCSTCDWWSCETKCCSRDAFGPALKCQQKQCKRGSRRKGGRRKQGKNENVRGFSSASEEEGEDRCTRLCSTDVETSCCLLMANGSLLEASRTRCSTCSTVTPYLTVLFLT